MASRKAVKRSAPENECKYHKTDLFVFLFIPILTLAPCEGGHKIVHKNLVLSNELTAKSEKF